MICSVYNVLQKKFTPVTLGDRWRSAIGDPELAGTWFIYGLPKQGKTSFCMQLAAVLVTHGKVFYNTSEEGVSLTFRQAVERSGISGSETNLLIGQMEFEDLKKYLSRRGSADIVFIDSVQFMDLGFEQYKQLKAVFPQKLFIYVSHVNGKTPDGNTAQRIKRDASVIFFVEGFRAFPVSRYGGKGNIDVNRNLAVNYWGN
jgi:hypothetical protein